MPTGSASKSNQWIFQESGFLVTTPSGDQFYLEAVLASDGNGQTKGRAQLVKVTLDAIRSAQYDKFSVMVHHSGLPNSQPPAKKLISELRTWLDGLDEKMVSRQIANHEWERGMNFIWEHEGLKLSFRPMKALSSRSLLGGSSSSLSISDPSMAVRNAITSKGTKYGKLELPFLIAVNFSSPFINQDEKWRLYSGPRCINLFLMNPNIWNLAAGPMGLGRALENRGISA